MTSRHVATVAVLVGLLLFPACAPRSATHSTQPHARACDDPLYARLRSAEPDSMSDREWARLEQLDAACVAERTAAPGASADGHGSHTGMGRMWLVMPLMMLVGGLMWLGMAV